MQDRRNLILTVVCGLILGGCIVNFLVGDKEWGYRFGAIFGAVFTVTLVVVVKSGAIRKRGRPRPRKRRPATEAKYVETDYERVMDRLQEFLENVEASDGQLEKLNETDQRILFGREFSLASAIAAAPSMILSEEELASNALIRAWRMVNFDHGGAFCWSTGGERTAEVVALSGFDGASPLVETISAAVETARVLRNENLALPPAGDHPRLHPESRTALLVPVGKNPLHWGWLQLEWSGERKLSEVESIFLKDIGREMAAGIGLKVVWEKGRGNSSGMLAATDRALDGARHYKAGRGRRIAALMGHAAAEIGISGVELETGLAAAYVMDLGEVGVPDPFFRLETELTPQERKFVAEHPHLSAKLVRQFLMLKPLEDVIVSHHERWDGLGYPHGISQENIPRIARLLSVCDALEAMLSDRPHRPGKSFSNALAVLKAESGAQFDPKMVEGVLEVAGKWWKEAKPSDAERGGR